MNTISRRSTFRLAAGTALAGLAAPSIARAADKSVTVAIDQANAKGGMDGYKINVLMLDDGTATAGQYDPAMGATNARKMVADKTCVAALGPMSSTPGKSMSPIFSQGGL